MLCLNSFNLAGGSQVERSHPHDDDNGGADCKQCVGVQANHQDHDGDRPERELQEIKRSLRQQLIYVRHIFGEPVQDSANRLRVKEPDAAAHDARECLVVQAASCTEG